MRKLLRFQKPQPLSPKSKTWVEGNTRYQKNKNARGGKTSVKGVPTTDSIEALSENDSAVDVMGDTKLKLIAHELLQSVRSNATIDWHHSEMARAKIRVAVKRILKKYGYPPDLQSAAIQTVLQQAEAFSEKWAA